MLGLSRFRFSGDRTHNLGDVTLMPDGRFRLLQMEFSYHDAKLTDCRFGRMRVNKQRSGPIRIRQGFRVFPIVIDWNGKGWVVSK